MAQVASSASSVCLLLASQIRAMTEEGMDVTALCAAGPWVEEARGRGIVVREVPLTRQVTPLRDIQALRELTREFRRGAYHVVNTHTPKAGLLGPPAARAARVPAIVHTVHGFLFHDAMAMHRRAFFQAAERFTAAFAHDLLFQSREDLEVARRLRIRRAERLHFVGNGIDLARFDPVRCASRATARDRLSIHQDARVVGVVARLTYEKGLAELFETVRAFAEKAPDVLFVVVGPEEPDQDDAVQAHEVAEMKATGRVRFLGLRHDVQDIYPAFDVFALPSHREGIPRALMEAAAMERPVVATDIRGCREVVENGETGLLVPVRDARALGQTLLALLDDPARARRMGQRGRAKIAADHDHRDVDKRIVSAIHQILERQGVRA